MNRKATPIIVLFVIILAGVLFYLLAYQDPAHISISTDQQVYHHGDLVRVTIRNLGERAVDIYCPGFCALGNFPTRVEQLSGGEWETLAGFCPSIEPVLGNYSSRRGYILHPLAGGKTFELELTNFESLQLEPGQRLRIVYYLGPIKLPVNSNEFTFQP